MMISVGRDAPAGGRELAPFHMGNERCIMADINALNSQISNANVNRTPVNTEIRVDKVPDRAAGNADDRQKVTEERKEELADVIAVSEDGDTVQATENSLNKLDEEEENKTVIRDGVPDDRENPIAKMKEAMEKVKKAIAEKDEKAEEKEEEKAAEEFKQQITSFDGYTDQQLEQLYIKGEISKADYDKEMDSREEQKTSDAQERNNFSKDMTEKIVLTEENTRGGAAIETAYSDRANNETMKPDERIKAMENLEDIMVKL